LKAYFENPQGYDCPKLYEGKNSIGELSAIYDFTLDPVAPITWHDGLGGRYQPNKHYSTDYGSIPKWLQPWIPKDRYLMSFLFHDSACEHEGMWYAAPGETVFVFVEMSRKEANAMLREMVLVEGALCEEIEPGKLKRDAKWIQYGTDVAAWWNRIRGRGPKYARSVE